MKRNRRGFPKALCYLCLIIVICLGLISIIGSNGDGGGGTTTTDTTPDGDTDGDNGEDGTTTPPAFSGFDFTLSEGDFWEYSWDYTRTYWDSWGGGGTTRDSGTFRVTLGSSKEIDGVTAYEVEVTGKSQRDSLNLAPRWDYLAIADNKFMGSDDGTTLTTIFDAQEGVWPGSGFFASFSSEDLYTATAGNINNDYISEPAISVGQSSSSSQCEYFPGVGTICGGDYNENDIKKEYYKENIGPLGYYSYSSISDMTSQYPWGSSTTINLGMISSSLQGDTALYDFEAEPNDSPGTAQSITPSRDIHGYCGDEDGGTDMTLNEIPEDEPNDHPQLTAQSLDQATMVDGSINDGDLSSIIDFDYYGTNYPRAVEDWYTFTLTSATTVNVELNHEGPVSTKIQLYLFNDTGTTSMGDVLALDEQTDPATTTRSITAALGVGTYLVAVDAWDTDGVSVDYTLDFLGATREMEDFYSFTLNAQTTVTITMDVEDSSADLDLYLYDENGATLIDSSIVGGTQESITTTIGPGTYVIGVDAFNGSSNYTLAVETS